MGCDDKRLIAELLVALMAETLVEVGAMAVMMVVSLLDLMVEMKTVILVDALADLMVEM